jgi:tetraprenyl-beta-curcumene synthase
LEATVSSTIGVLRTCLELLTGVHPAVSRELSHWIDAASRIPDSELRRQALASLRTKRFHCVGGAVLALTCRPRMEELVKAIVAIQTVSDYLDNLCDRMERFPDPDNFALLHEAMMCCVDPERPSQDYYRLCRTNGGDGGYLDSLVERARCVLRDLPNYPVAKDAVSRLARLYSELQVTKHQDRDLRDALMADWFARRGSEEEWRSRCDGLKWWEFGAAAGSTLGMFSLICASGRDDFSQSDVSLLDRAYFPGISGLHILLDYFIDREEDSEGGDLNFVSYYSSPEEAEKSLLGFIERALLDACSLPEPDRDIHTAVVKGLVAMYLSDPKVRRQGLSLSAEKMVMTAGLDAKFLTKSCGLMRRVYRF